MRETHPTTLIILGATGDLAQKKLFPALLDLYVKDMLPPTFTLIAFARRDFSDETFRAFVHEALGKSTHSPERIKQFLSCISYVQGLIDDASGYATLSNYLRDLDIRLDVCSNKLFYLAVPPVMYHGVFTLLAASGLTIPCVPGANEEKTIWTRVLVEKPFGNSLTSARELDMLLGTLFVENQIYRIDHYLAKETVQNITSFRFSNGLFEPMWNKDHIERVEIRVLEHDSAHGRGTFYDGLGALADVGQNHILQMLALVTMEHPGGMSADNIRDSRSQALMDIVFNPAESTLVRAQYKGYTEEEGVDTGSLTETYFKTVVEVNNDRWRGVPFSIESGKALEASVADIKVYFKEAAACLCPPDGHDHQNILTFTIQPHEGISLALWTKKSGFQFDLTLTPLSFTYAENMETREITDAYERVLFDCIRGDQTLFVTQRGVLAEWSVVESIQNAWKNLSLVQYDQGSKAETINNT